MKNTNYTIKVPNLPLNGPLDFFKSLLGTNKSSKEIGEVLRVDMHGHWLPGVDDGAKSIGEGIALLRGLSEMGFQKAIATPHIMQGRYNNQPAHLRKVFRKFSRCVKNAGIDIDLSLGAEYMLDEGFVKRIENGPLLCLSGNYVLVEMSLLQAFPALEEVLFELQLKGYRPVLAHPERYTYYDRSSDIFERLKKNNCFFQLNILSLRGYYGRKVAETARALLSRNWYDFAGTDVHRPHHLSAARKVSLPRIFNNMNLV